MSEHPELDRLRALRAHFESLGDRVQEEAARAIVRAAVKRESRRLINAGARVLKLRPKALAAGIAVGLGDTTWRAANDPIHEWTNGKSTTPYNVPVDFEAARSLVDWWNGKEWIS